MCRPAGGGFSAPVIETSRDSGRSVICGKTCSSSAPPGTRGNVGLVESVVIDMDGGKLCESEGVERESVAIVAPSKWVDRRDRRSDKGISRAGRVSLSREISLEEFRRRER